MRRLATTLTMAMAGTAAVVAAAEAQTIGIAPVKPCYLTGEQVTATATGFTANGQVGFGIDGTELSGGPFFADPAGSLGLTIGLGTMRAVRTHTLTATDATNPALTASAAFLGTTNTVSVKPKRGSAGTPRRLKGYGFLAGPKVYMHVRRRGYKSDKRIARAKAPCGTFEVRKTIVPAGASDGVYKVQFDAKRRYSKRTRPRLLGSLTVYRTLSSTAARASLAVR